MFHLERIDHPVLLLRGNSSKDDFTFGDSFDFVLTVVILSPTSCFVKHALGHLPMHCFKKFLRDLEEMGFTEVDYEHKKKSHHIELK